MVGPSSQISKLLLGLLIALIIFYIYMDVQLYLRIQNYPLERNYHFNTTTITTNNANTATDIPQRSDVTYESETWLSCELNPLCHVTVKAILLDHTNHYLFAPLATIFDNIIGFSRSTFITANMISFFHVGVACVAGKLVSSDSLGYRRLGVVMFQFRTFLDDLDGHVARVKKNIRGERSEVGTTGYYVDGICDGLGCIALILGMFFYLKNNPPRRGYLQLPMVDTRVSDAPTKTKLKPTTRKVAKKVISFTGQLLLSSTAWNRYIAVYQNMLESNDVTPLQQSRQQIVFKSTWFFCIAWLWRIVNVHSLLHCVLLSIFCDKLWEFLKAIQYSGYVILLVCICITEMHLLEAHNFIFNTGGGGSTNITSF
ncbi:ceramide phosphoethanolamine synthase isoform X2 [Lucilia cuprina]|uniref:ceramide phosphoethanolamine synthase isoform X2 n=1 Tax=Lucilia cuprina TaxID=7375 RepID=UPI001F05B744|nr:ceramide phosphoethanolamine synthase isoform X2 [Lucilia cuprina]XP_046811212.1 ceramide phosphoethanolamine synthase isoform X2 [Lucilia cuprina]